MHVVHLTVAGPAEFLETTALKTTPHGIETMPRRQPKPRRAVPSRKLPGPTPELRRALARRKKVVHPDFARAEPGDRNAKACGCMQDILSGAGPEAPVPAPSSRW